MAHVQTLSLAAIIVVVTIVIIVIALISATRGRRTRRVSRASSSEDFSRLEVRAGKKSHRQPKQKCCPRYLDAPPCPNIGLGARCSVDANCAVGLACLDGSCVCAPPNLVTAPVTTILDNDATVSWQASANADYYDLYLYRETDDPATDAPLEIVRFLAATTYTFLDLALGTYEVRIFAGSNGCGRADDFTLATFTIECFTDANCTSDPSLPTCRLGKCGLLQCQDTDGCPPGHRCLDGFCSKLVCQTPGTLCRDLPPLPLITNVQVTPVTATKFLITWDDIPEALRYGIQFSLTGTINGVPFPQIVTGFSSTRIPSLEVETASRDGIVITSLVHSVYWINACLCFSANYYPILIPGFPIPPFPTP